MKKNLQTLIFIMLTAVALVSNAQTRYIDEVFTDVKADTSIMYGQNFEYYTNFASLQPLMMDVYRPLGDTVTNRPVIMFSHNGSFLPQAFTNGPLLGLCFNERRDSSLVELCKRFARRGYVAVSFDYRLGWNPTAGAQEVRTATIIQAVYRAMQDAKSLVRFFKNDYANNHNMWGIDTGKFVIGGTNSGAYVALAASTLNDTSELSNIKFVGSNGPFIKQDTLGDFDGFGGVQNHGNYPGISSRFQCVLSLGGAVGDTSWVKFAQTTVLAFQGVNETLTPYNTGVVITSIGQPVIEVSGAGDFMPYVDALGKNNAFKPNHFAQGPPNQNGNGARTTSIEGLYPFYAEGFEPWNWYDANCYTNSSGMQNLNPGAGPAKASHYIDTIMGYSIPRLYKLLINPAYVSGIPEVNREVNMSLFPNPASSEINISVSSEQQPISSIQVIDVTGRLVNEISQVNSFSKNLDVSGMSNGLYIVSIKLTDGTGANRRVVIEK